MNIEKTQDTEGLWDLLLLADPSVEAIEEYLADSEVFTATESGEVCGVCVLKQQKEQEYEIMNIAVPPDKEGRGIGMRLLEHVKAHLSGRDGIELKICTGNTSTDQIRLYEKAGFTRIGIVPGYFAKKYPEPIDENGELCEDLVVLRQFIE